MDKFLIVRGREWYK